MPTQDYRLLSGERAPGVTTVNKNIGWSTENLIRWANRQGLDGIDIRSARGRAAASIGTLVHAVIEAEVLGTAPPDIPEEYKARVDQGLQTFQRWRRQTQIEIVATEVYGVDEEYKAGWCVDAITKESDGLGVMDYKSGKGPFPEHFIQVAAYAHFFERLTGIALCGAHIGRFSTETGIFHQVFFPRYILDVGFKAWTWARALHQVRPMIEGYVR